MHIGKRAASVERKQALPCNSTGRSVGASSIEDDIPAFGLHVPYFGAIGKPLRHVFSIYGREMP